jgi:hypothetical protein
VTVGVAPRRPTGSSLTHVIFPHLVKAVQVAQTIKWQDTTPVAQTMTQQDTSLVSRTITLQDTTEVLTKLADDIDRLMRYGVQPLLPEALVQAAERITIVVKLCRPTAPVRQMPISQLVTSLAIPGEDVTAKSLWTQLTQCGWNTTSQAVSVALHRAAVRGLFERPRRGVYRLVATNSSSELVDTKPPTGKPSTLETGRERNDAHELAELEEEIPM